MKNNLVFKKWDVNTGNAQYLLTDRGNQIAGILDDIYKDVKV